MTTKKSATKEIALVEQQQNAISTWVGGDTFEMLSGLATKFSQSQLVPTHFKGKPHDCFIAMQMAHRMQIDPFLTLQNLNIINGKPSWAAPFAISLANERGPFSEKIKFTINGDGDNLSVTAHAALRDSGEVAQATVSLKMAKLEGWTKNLKYQTMPEQMLCYRAATFLIRRHCPEILNGMQTNDEVEDISYSRNERVVEGVPVAAGSAASKLSDLNKQIEETI